MTKTSPTGALAHAATWLRELWTGTSPVRFLICIFFRHSGLDPRNKSEDDAKGLARNHSTFQPLWAKGTGLRTC